MIERNNSAKHKEALIWKDIKNRRLKEAAISCAKLNREYPAYAPGWHTMSYVAIRLNNAAIGLDAINHAVELEPDNPEWLLQKANCLLALIKLEDAKAIAIKLHSVTLKTAYQCSTLARIFVRLDMNEKALGLYQRAISLDETSSGDYYNVATVQRSLGYADDAEKNLNQCIQLNPKDSDAYYLRSIVKTQTKSKNNVDSLKSVIDAGWGSPKDKVKLNYALAKELEDIGEYNSSFQALTLASGIRRDNINYQLEADLNTIEAIKNTFGADLFSMSGSRCESDEPIFILGMPRTGTTLVERILSSHDQVFSAGELNNFAHCLMGMVTKQNKNKLSREALVSLTATLNFGELGKGYIESTRNITGHTTYFIDKLPLNFLYVGLIHLAMPNAKIINLQRNPMDTCYAVYKSLFEDGYPFSYDLDELGRYYVAYHQLMTHWNDVLPGVIYTVNYEKVIADPEYEAKKLVSYCGLEWQEKCLKFYENKQASTTASASQIRQPIYSSSVNKWRCYEEQLQPVVDILNAAGIAIE